MNKEFDNEIDALLRRTAQGEGSAPGARKAESGHLDADEISSFAENALPAKARSRYTAHLADCDLCRRDLSALITLNAQKPESEPVPKERTVIAPAPIVPWYRRLFAFPNLAYGLGALVLVFTGITAFTLLQNYNRSENLAMANTASREVPSAIESKSDELTDFGNTSGESAESAANLARLSPTNSSNAGEADGSARPDAANLPNEADSKDEIFRDNKAPAALAKKSRPPTTATRRNQGERAIDDDAPDVGAEQAAPPEPMATGRTARDKNKIITERSETIQEISPAAGAKFEKESDSYREVNGKSFRRSNDVWYDTAYKKNQPTTNIRRGTTPYRNLDLGLRLIADELKGTVVVVWKAKAYRID